MEEIHNLSSWRVLVLAGSTSRMEKHDSKENTGGESHLGGGGVVDVLRP
jgi:hypothetical protein